MTTTEQLLSEATVQLVLHPSVVLLDAADRLARLVSGDTDPFTEYGMHRTDAGWQAALDTAEAELAWLLQERAA